jgi:uncharacterized membrane protein YidH (DUF202 family)
MAMTEPQEPEQIVLMKRMVALAERQTAMSAERSEMSEVRSYHNAERTLSVWVRTALASMVLGIAMDRFGLLVGHPPAADGANAALLDSLSTWAGAGLVALGIAIVAATGLRFFAYAQLWRRRHTPPPYHGPFLGPFFALLVAAFGVLLLVVIFAVRPSA